VQLLLYSTAMQTHKIKAAAADLSCPFSQQDQAVSAAGDLKGSGNHNRVFLFSLHDQL